MSSGSKKQKQEQDPEVDEAAEVGTSEIKRYICKAPCSYKNKAWVEGDILTVIGPAAVPSYFEPV